MYNCGGTTISVPIASFKGDSSSRPGGPVGGTSFRVDSTSRAGGPVGATSPGANGASCVVL